MKKKPIFVLALFSVFFISSCEKEENIVEKSKATTKMRIFENFSQLDLEIQKTTNFTYDEMLSYEKSIGFDSYGKIADEKYYSLVSEDTNITFEKVHSWVQQNPEYFVVEQSGNDFYFETKYSLSPFRYVMNKDRMFKVDTLLFKIFETGYAVCGQSYFEEMKAMTEETFLASNSKRGFEIHKNIAKRTDFPVDVSAIGGENDKEKVRFQIQYGERYRTAIEGNILYLSYFTEMVKGYRKATGIWWRVKRTLSADYWIYYFIYNHLLESPSNISPTGSAFVQKFDYKLENVVLFNLTIPHEVNVFDYYVDHATGYARIPAVSYNLSNL